MRTISCIHLFEKFRSQDCQGLDPSIQTFLNIPTYLDSLIHIVSRILIQSMSTIYICGNLILLQVDSRDFFQAEKERTPCKAEQIHKMPTFFNQNGPKLIDLLLRKARNLILLFAI